MEDYVVVGRIGPAHGLRGEVVVDIGTGRGELIPKRLSEGDLRGSEEVQIGKDIRARRQRTHRRPAALPREPLGTPGLQADIRLGTVLGLRRRSGNRCHTATVVPRPSPGKAH